MFRHIAALTLVFLIPSTVLAVDLTRLSENFRKQADIIKDHRHRTDGLRGIADGYKWNKYKQAEKDYVYWLKRAYVYQRQPKKLVGANAQLYLAAKGYRKEFESLFKSLNIRGPTVGETRYGPLKEFDKVFEEFKKLTD